MNWGHNLTIRTRSLIAAFGFSILSAVPALADAVANIDQMIADVRTMQQVHDDKYGAANAGALMLSEMQANGVTWAQRYAQTWGGWYHVDWSHTSSFYNNAAHTLDSWRSVALRDEMSEADIMAALDPAMHAVVEIDSFVDRMVRDAMRHTIIRAKYLDIAQRFDGGTDGYNYWNGVADREGELAAAALHEDTIKYLKVIPEVPEAGMPVINPGRQQLDALSEEAEALAGTNDHRAMYNLLQRARIYLLTDPSDEARQLVTLLELLADRHRFAETPMTELLDQIEATHPGPIRDALLRDAESGFLERLASMAPVLATEAANGSAEDRESTATKMLDMARRLTMLRDDINKWSTPPSGLLKGLSALKSVSDIMDMANSGSATAKEMMTLFNDASTLVQPTWVSHSAPFALQAGVITGQLDHTAKAWGEATTALEGVRDAIGGDLSGLQRAQDSARRLEKLLSPRAFLDAVKDSIVPSWAGNLPFLRSIL